MRQAYRMTEITQLRRYGLFDARVPRYTSYPTAPHFSTDVGPLHTSDWIGAISPGETISLYLHVPFCRRLCWFCACRTQGTSTLRPVEAYLQTLKAELALITKTLPSDVRLGHIHWGGGTPTLLSPDMIAELAEAVRETAPFAEGAQFSVEIDPMEIDSARLDALAAAGMTRASIGVQDFDPEIQATIGRPQSYEATRDAVEGLREKGITSLNADILYGLPHQTDVKIADSVQKLLSLSPDRAALFGYAHVPWMAKRQGLIPTEALPSPEARLGLFETAQRLFDWDGYQSIGIDHFARPSDGLTQALRAGTLRRNFQGYTDDQAETLIGVGASAISRYRHGYTQNAPSTSTYQKAIREGCLATARGHAFTGEDRLRAWVIERLLCDYRVDIFAGAKLTDTPVPPLVAAAYAAVEAFPGMVAYADGLFAILPQARPLARIIAKAFDAYEAPENSHSSAV